MAKESSRQPNNVQLKESKPNQQTHAVVGVREKLIVIFLLAKVLPLILLAWIAWRALISLGTISQEIAVTGAQDALTALAVENVERITTDAAQKFAEYLYQRDADISFLAKAGQLYCSAEDHPSKRLEDMRLEFERLFFDFGESKFGHLRQPGNWEVDECGMEWVRTEPLAAFPIDETRERSTNPENNSLVLHSTSFNYRAPYGFGDHPDNFIRIPLYDEIALLDKNGMQIAKYLPPGSTKTRFRFPEELLDISDPQNTFVRSEHYFEELLKLGKDDIYVSDVIGAYVPTSFIGMHTKNFKASRRIDALINALETEADRRITETSWKLRVLNAELKNEKNTFNSRQVGNERVRTEIDRRLGKNQIWKIQSKSVEQASEELRTLGFPELAEEILNIPFDPENSGFAGAENPLGIRFEGIVRWAKPVVDENDEIQGYVTFALNHDHLMAMIDHICPMQQRFTELSDGFEGNYAFVWDYQCRSIIHPRHYSIYGYNPETGRQEIPWLEQTLYNAITEKGFDIEQREDWQTYIAMLEYYEPWTGDENSLAFQSRTKRPTADLTRRGFVGLDGRYLNTAPQCTGWMDLTRDGGSGSFYILWSDLYKLTTAAAIPYYTGQYSPEVQGNRRGFGFVTIGAGIDDFVRPAETMGDQLTEQVDENIYATTYHLAWTTIILSMVVIFIAVWMASYLSKKLQWLIDGITHFRRGHRHFRFSVEVKDEFGHLAHSFDEMAENVVHSVHSPLVITDMDMKIIYANEHALAIIGANLEDVVGSSYKDKTVYDYGSKYCPIAALREGRESAVCYVAQTGKYLLGVANCLTDEQGNKQGYIIVSNDVTEMSLKQAELELANQHKSRFLARMSHELRTPMNAIIGINEITQSKLNGLDGIEGRQELTGNLEHLKQSSKHLLRLLNDILEASNLESGTAALSAKPVDLAILLGEIARETKLECAEKKLNWSEHFSFSATQFLADGSRLCQVLQYLIDNALKYTPEHGKITLTVKEKERRDGEVLMFFAVEDTGVGIPQDKMEMIFLPFEQAEAHESKYTTGSGLGLVVVRKILELFGTEISIRSEVGKGSEFSFDVWLRESTPSGQADIADMKGRFAGQRALVVDDVRLNRIVLVNLLKEAGFAVDEAKDGKEGLEMFEGSPENAYNIVFMDIQMPVMDGWESAAAIRGLSRSDAQSVPIVTVSANAFPDDVARSLASGMNAHYAKPIERSVLAEILATYGQPVQ